MAEEKQEVRRIVPPVDIYETSNDVVLVADVPGLTKEKLELDIEKDELTIKGAFEEPNGKGTKLTSECLYGKYDRTFVIGETIDQEKISAKLENGVLIITLPKREKVKPRKIEIEAETE